MGYEVTTTGRITVDPPLGAAERTYLSRLARSAPVTRFTPGHHSPWMPTADGSALEATMELGTKEPVAEWLAYLRSRLLTPRARADDGHPFKGFTYDHALTGDVEVSGRTHGDRWHLLANDAGVWVHRQDLPCAHCWASTLFVVRPSAAYRFTHPVRWANCIDDRPIPAVPETPEAECLTRTWQPVGRTLREVTWPMRRDHWERWWIDLDAFPEAAAIDDDPSWAWSSGADDGEVWADVIDLGRWRRPDRPPA